MSLTRYAQLGTRAVLAARDHAPPDPPRDHACEVGPVLRLGRFLLPAADRGLARHVLRNLYVAHGPGMRSRRRMLPWLPTPALDRLLVTGSPSDRDAAREFLVLVRDTAGDVLPVADGPGSSVPRRWIILGDASIHARDRRLLFVFDDGARYPSVAFKVRPLRSSGRSLHSEWQALARLHRIGPLAGTVPFPLAYRRSGGFELLATSVLPGRSAYVEMRGRLVPARRLGTHFAAAADWLARFHAATRVTTESAGWPDLSGFDTAEPLLERLDRMGQRIPRSAGHGDFWAHNLLIRGRHSMPGVVDWEHFAGDAPCFIDLFHFPLTYGLNYRWRGKGPHSAHHRFQHTFLEETVLSSAVRAYCRRYCLVADLDPAALQPLLHLALLVQASRLKGPAWEGVPWTDLGRALEHAPRPAFLP